jgi:signal transduction histidine kinase
VVKKNMVSSLRSVSLVNGLVFRLTFTVCIVSFVVTALFVGYSWYLGQSELVRRVDREISFLSQSLEKPLWDLDSVSVNQICTAFSRTGDVVGLVVVAMDTIFNSHLEKNRSSVTRVAYVKHNNQVIGSVCFTFSDEGLYKSLRQQVTIAVILVIIILIIQVFLTKLLVHAQLRLPLKWLKELVAGDLQSGIFPVHIHAPVSEFVPFEAVLTTMIQTISKQINDLKKLNEDLYKKQSQLTDAAEKERLHQLQIIQSDKMASLGLLVSGVAHEINNPNNFVMLNTPLLREAINDAKPILDKYYKENGDFIMAGMNYSQMVLNIDKLLDGIESGAKRIQRIVADLKDYARQDRHEQDREVDVNKIAQSAASLLEIMLRKKNADFSLTLCEEPLLLKGSFQHLEQVIVNLLQNACEALTNTAQKINLVTSLDKIKNRVVVVVSDEGCGIDSQNITKLTDPFFTTKQDLGGTGLGLSVSAGIVKDHGGLLQFESKPGIGTTVSLILPRKRMSDS